MIITKEKLESLGACVESVKFFDAHYKEIDIVDLLRDVLQYKEEVSEKYNEDIYRWCYWLIARNVSRKAGVRFAVYAAEKVLYIYEGTYPLDERPRKAIAAAKAYLENPSDKNARAVDAAAANAAYAADAIWAAADAAHAAARAAAHAAYAAARAVDAAANAARAAITSANTDLSIKDQILEFGISLLEECQPAITGDRRYVLALCNSTTSGAQNVKEGDLFC